VDLSIGSTATTTGDKAIDLVDKAGARTQVPMLSLRQQEGKGGAAHPRLPRRVESSARSTELSIAQVLCEKISRALEVHHGPTGRRGPIAVAELEGFSRSA